MKPIDIQGFIWRVGGEETYLIENGTLGEPLFQGPLDNMEGSTLKNILEENDYYLIFQDLKAFSKGTNTDDIRIYKQYLASECQLVLLVVDSSYITIYRKDNSKLSDLYQNAKELGYSNLEFFTDETDMRTGLSVW